MNIEPLAILSLIAYVFPSGICSKIWRDQLLTNETSIWTDACRVTDRKSCEDFVGCCKKFPEMARCTESGGILEYPACSYWSGEQFDPDTYGECSCVEKFIFADYKSKCESEDDKTKCLTFYGCCVGADKGRCGQFVGGELELPACEYSIGKPFNHDEAVCRCAIESPNATMKENLIKPTSPNATLKINTTKPMLTPTTPRFPATSMPPVPTPTTTPAPAVKLGTGTGTGSGGEKNSGSCVWIVTVTMLTAVVFHRYQQPMV